MSQGAGVYIPGVAVALMGVPLDPVTVNAPTDKFAIIYNAASGQYKASLIGAALVLVGDVNGPGNANHVDTLTGPGTNLISAGSDGATNLGSASSRFKSLNLSAGVGAGVFLYSGSGDANAVVGLASGQLSFGPGGASALDARIRRSGISIFTIDNFGAGGATVLPGADTVGAFGTATTRWSTASVQTYNVFAGSGDANASASMSSNALKLGPGAATAPDVKLTRSALATLQIDNNAGGAVTVVGPADINLTLGTTALRLTNIIAAQSNWYNAASDANAQASVTTAAGGGALSLGVGGATALDIRLQRTGLKTVTLDDTAAGGITVRFPAASTITAAVGALTVNGAGGINLQNGGTTWADLGVTTASTITLSASAPTVQWVKGAASPAISHAAQTTDTATNNLTIGPQAPFATATGVNRTPGSLIVNIAAPTNGGTTEGGLYVQRGGTSQVQMGPYSSTYSAVWFGNANLGGASTFSFLGNNDGSQTFLNNPTAGGTIFLRFANVANGLSLTSTTLNPAADNAVTIGAAATRFVAVNSIAFNVYAAVSDGTAVVTASNNAGGQILLGASSASGQTVRARCTAAKTLILDDNLGTSTLNLQFGPTAAFGGGSGVIGIANANTNPTNNPTGGGILYATGGAGTWRGSGSTVTTFGPAGPHCGRCGYDAWRVATYNTAWRSWHFECSHCGAEYKGGPAEVHDRLSAEQRREYLRDGMAWEDVARVMGEKEAA